MINEKLFSLLTQKELDLCLIYTIVIRGCDDILISEQLELDVAKKVFSTRMDAMGDLENLELVCIKRINSILELCHGRI